MRFLRQAFAIDLRSLAALRIALGLILLIDLTARATNLSAHYTDAGVFPRSARIELDAAEAAAGRGYHWSLHMLSGDRWAQAALFAAAGWFALLLVIGYRTRLATVASFVLAVSLQSRNPLVIDAGDLILKCLLFWSMFLPLGARASLDRLLSSDEQQPDAISSIASAALLLQVCMIYWSTAAEKHDAIWARDYTALYYMFSIDTFARPLAHWLLRFPRLLTGLTALAYWTEWLGPFFALSPLGKGRLRVCAVLLFWGLHFGTAITMELGLLPWIAMAAWLPFLPGVVWERPRAMVGRRSARWRALAESRASVAHGLRRWLDRPEKPYAAPRRLTWWLVGLLLTYTAVWNLNQVTGLLDTIPSVPRQWKIAGWAIGIDQSWTMFAPFPMTTDGWYVMKGVLADGTVVNLWRPGEPLPLRKPTAIRALAGGRRWAKYLHNMLTHEGGVYAHRLADWLRRRWDRDFAGDSPQRRVRSVELVYQIEETLGPGRKSNLITPYILWRGEYDADTEP